MERAAFFHSLEEMMELPGGTIHGDEELVSLGKWDSMAVLNFIALADEQFAFAVDPEVIAACVTPNDLARVLGDHVR